MAQVKFLKGTSTAYKALATKNPEVFYFTTDDNKLYLGGLELSTPQDVANAVALTNNSTKGNEALKNAIDLLNNNASTQGSVDYKIDQKVKTVLGNSGDLTKLTTTAKTIIAAINELKTSIGTATTSGAVTIAKDTTISGVAARYTVSQGGTALPITIDIPKDMVVESGEVVTNPTGKTAGTYIKLKLANAAEDELFINVGSLIDIYTAKQNATQVQLAINSTSREISATIVSGGITATELATDSVIEAKIKNGAVTTNKIGAKAVTSAKLSDDVNTSLGKADSALQEADITTGANNGQIKVGSTDVSVKGLAAAAYKAVDTSIAAASTSANVPTSQAVASFVEGKGYKTTDNNTTYTFATGDNNGQIKVTPSGGTAQNVAVKGLAGAAYKAVDTSISAASTSANLPTSAAVASFVEGKGYKTTDNNTTYTLTQDATDGHKITLTPSSGTATTITIPDNNTTYTGTNGVSVSGTTISNSGVRSVATGDNNGTIKVNTNGTSTNVAVKGLAALAYKASLSASDVGAIATSAKGAKNGVAELDANGLVPAAQLPSYVDDVIEGYLYNSKFYKESAHTTEITGETGKIYVDLSNNKTYRWSGSAFAEISASLALGTTSSTAYRGDYGNTAYTHATDANRLTTAKASGLYKIAATANGHVQSLTAVTKDDITALGIPGSDTNTWNAFKGATADAAGTAGYVPAPAKGDQAKFFKADGTWATPTNTTYTGANGVSISGTTISNSGVRSIASGSANGTISVNTNGTSADVAVKGLGSAAYTASTAYATSGHTHTTSLATDTGTSTVTLASAGKYKLTAGGNSVIFTMPTIPSYSSKAAASGGTDVSLVTTGEKYTWNNKSNLTIGTTATTAAAGNHTHTTSLASDTGTSAVTLAHGGKYKLTAGGNSVIFTMPSDNNTTYTFATGDNNGQIKVTPSGGSAQAVAVKGLAAAAYKTVDTSIASGSTSANVPTTGAVVTFVTNQINSAISSALAASY